jgi:ligand-binding sensor domain-containing protein/DNA-binding response OmpR family regulator/nitrogen-specific signal transduction histidine kinase
MKQLVFLFLFVVLQVNMEAQQIIARQIPFFYQLSSNEIWDFYQDREGYLWIGTTNGLVRYDGFRLQSFRSDYKSPDLLANNSIVCMSDNDSYVWIGTRTGLNLFDKKTCRIIPSPEETLRNKNIEDILIDENTFSWVATGGTVYKCNPDGSLIRSYPLSSYTINHLYMDKEGNIWGLTWGDGLFKYDPSTDAFTNYPRIGMLNAPFIMYQDRAGNYWIGTWGDGLWQFFPDQPEESLYKKRQVINERSGQPDPIFYSLVQDDTFGYLWALSYNELYALKIKDDGTLENVDIHNLLDTHMMYTRIFKDRNGNLWLSSYDMAYTIFFDNSKIENYPLPQIKERLGWDANITHLCLDNDGIMWVHQDRYGLSVYDLHQDKLSGNEIRNYPESLEIRVIIKSDYHKGVWVGTGGTPRVMKLSQRNPEMFVEEDINLQTLTDDPGEIKQLIEDGHGNLWILTSTHLFLKPFDSESLLLVDRNTPSMLMITEDQQGNVWAIGTNHNLYRLCCAGNNMICELHSPVSVLAENEGVNNVCVDKEGCFWIITSLGRIYKSEAGKQLFQRFSLEKEIEESSVLDLRADAENVWIITNKKVLQYNTGHETIYDYFTSDGNISVNVFRNKAVTQDGHGGIYVGGHGGFSYIRPSGSSTVKSYEIHPAVTDIRVENQSILFSATDKERNPANRIDKVYLKAGDRNIEISFSALQYSLNARERIAYKLEGADADWIYLDYYKNAAFYNQLKKGSYRFWLKSEYERGKWTKEEMLLVIEKSPAIYETWYACLFYILTAGLCVYLLLKAYFKRLKAKNDIRFREELNRAKIDYFTNVSHDILTPLTIISCAVDNLETQEAFGSKQSQVLKSNVEKLKRLIQQILDFRKMDMGRMQLNISHGDVKGFLATICQTGFQPLAQKKNITLTTSFPPDKLWGYLDFDKLDKIAYNLLSNALKYTSENKQVTVAARKQRKGDYDYLVLEVKDEGIGILPKEKSLIFTRFYTNRKNQPVESNGIGLSLTKEMVELHYGTITVESELGIGSCFTVVLPIDKAFYEPDEFAEGIISDEAGYAAESSATEDTDRFNILLVDDNTELLYILKEIFGEKQYHVITATSGKQAWEKLAGCDTDVVISDVMMPDENGWEFCKRIKSDIRFSHIPVIILTAKNGLDDQVSSYEAGADGYIAKPFDRKVLLARVDNLVKAYKMRHAAFRKEQNLSLDSMASQSADKQFLQSIMDSIMEHIEESEFDLEKLSSEMNMSKSTLHRKIKLIAGLTPLDFIRNIKMKRACLLLKEKNLTISEIAYSLGFNNPKYFSKCFKEEFGVTPTEYQQM